MIIYLGNLVDVESRMKINRQLLILSLQRAGILSQHIFGTFAVSLDRQSLVFESEDENEQGGTKRGPRGPGRSRSTTSTSVLVSNLIEET